MKSLRSQSAMEYLMTYGWSILILVIVLVAVFQLGILNPNSAVQAIPAGACQIIKTPASISLAGQCNNNLPQFVAYSGNSLNDYIDVNGDFFSGYSFTINGWVEWNSSVLASPPILPGNPNHVDLTFIESNSQINFGIRLDQFEIQYCGWPCPLSGGSGITGNTWHDMALTWNNQSHALTIFEDGKQIVSTTAASVNIIENAPIRLAGGTGIGCCNEAMDGMVSNVQVYNTSLSASEISALYQEGIGGAPIDPTHIVGWWPLKGNAQDYSGNGHDGVQTGISYTSAWAPGYVQP